MHFRKEFFLHNVHVFKKITTNGIMIFSGSLVPLLSNSQAGFKPPLSRFSSLNVAMFSQRMHIFRNVCIFEVIRFLNLVFTIIITSHLKEMSYCLEICTILNGKKGQEVNILDYYGACLSANIHMKSNFVA